MCWAPWVHVWSKCLGCWCSSLELGLAQESFLVTADKWLLKLTSVLPVEWTAISPYLWMMKLLCQGSETKPVQKLLAVVLAVCRLP